MGRTPLRLIPHARHTSATVDGRTPCPRGQTPAIDLTRPRIRLPRAQGVSHRYIGYEWNHLRRNVSHRTARRCGKQIIAVANLPRAGGVDDSADNRLSERLSNRSPLLHSGVRHVEPCTPIEGSAR